MHWSQTPEGRKRMSENTKKRWKELKAKGKTWASHTKKVTKKEPKKKSSGWDEKDKHFVTMATCYAETKGVSAKQVIEAIHTLIE